MGTIEKGTKIPGFTEESERKSKRKECKQQLFGKNSWYKNIHLPEKEAKDDT